MTRLAALALLALAAGCAASRSGGGERVATGPAREQARRGGAVAPLAVSPAAAPADSLTLREQRWLSKLDSLSRLPDFVRVLGADTLFAPSPDSLTLRWTLPTRGAIGCWADPASRVYDRQRWSVLRLKWQPPWYAPGMMDRPAGMDSIRAWTRPDTVASGCGWPGDSCAARVARGPEYTVVTRNGVRWSCWSALRR